MEKMEQRLSQEIAQIQPVDEHAKELAQKRWNSIAKPLHSLGLLEDAIVTIAGVQRTPQVRLEKKCVVPFCADNGVVAQGVTQSGQEVTAIVTENFCSGKTSVCAMARAAGADVIPVDIGVSKDVSGEGLRVHKIAYGTADITQGPAMSREQAAEAILYGMDLAKELKAEGYSLIATGEMGIGNTTTSSAVAAAVLRCDPILVTGKGAGLSEEGLLRKKQLIAEAIRSYDLYAADPFTVLSTVGGFDIAGLVGMCVGGALFHLPIVLDGVISMVAALVAERLFPGTKEYLLPSHKGKEPAVELLMKELQMEPVIDGKMALGEGTGAVMLFALLDMALQLYETGTTFSGMQISAYKRFT